jgi:hypothetical protein
MIKLFSLVIASLVVIQSSAIGSVPYISAIKGQAELKRKTSAKDGFRSIKKTPISLQEGDQLRLKNGAIVSVFCPGDTKAKSITQAGERLGIRQLCRKWKSVRGKGSPQILVLAETNLQQPFLISPHRTLLLNPNPRIRWNPVEGAMQYTVLLKNKRALDQKILVKGTQLTYSGTPALQPSIPYSIEIQTNTGKSAQSTDNQFLVLRPNDAKAVQKEIDLLNQSDAPPELKAIQIASYYASYQVPDPSVYGLTDQTSDNYRLTAEAIEVIESTIKQNGPTPLLHRTLGDLYAQAGVMYSSEQAYLKAIEQVQSLEDVEEWSLALYGLGVLHEVAKNPQQALIWYGQARVGFSLLEDKRVKNVEDSITRLRSTEPSVKNP